MKTKFTLLLTASLISISIVNAQTNTFPQTGNAGIGTLTPATSLQVIGKTRMGSTTDYAQVDDNGNLSFKGSAVYKVGGNKYAFQYSSSPGYGLFFNSADFQYEFRDAAARPVFYVNANSGDGYFLSGVRIGNSALTTTGNLRWSGSDFEGYNGTVWQSLTGKNSWGLKGNTGSDSSVNFIGTIDSKPLVFRVKNDRAGYIDYNTKGTTTFGYQAMLNNTSGIRNTAVGYQALKLNITGSYNTAVGYMALTNGDNGSSNCAFGEHALYSNTGDANMAFGPGALGSNTDGSDNVAIGSGSLYSNLTGGSNVAIGSDALFYNSGSYNIGTGYSALFKNTTGDGNIATGFRAMEFNTTGSSNIAIGKNALQLSLSGNNNIAIGESALSSNKSGSNNIAIGYLAEGSADNLTNATAIGYLSLVDASNKVRIGNASVTSIGGQVGWTNFSDERVKKDIKENVPGLNFIKLLRTVTYHYNVAKENELLGIKDSLSLSSRNDIEKINFSGLLAQEVDAAAQKIGYDFSGVDKTGKIMGLRYSEFVVPLIKAVQELSSENDALKTTNENLQNEVNDLKDKIDMIMQKIGMNESNQVSSVQSSNSKTITFQNDMARLEQNKPNPAGNSTIINYYMPQNSMNAQLVINDAAGRALKNISLNTKGTGQINFNTSALIAGSYFYTLMVDGKKIDTKQMIISK